MKNFDLHILPECYVDTKVINAIVSHGRKTHNHKMNCDKVAEAMKKEFADDFAVGVVDKDKKVLPYSQEFEIVFQTKHLELMKHYVKKHYLIFIIPAMEKWLIENLDEIGSSLSDFGLPNDFKKFKEITKTSKSEQNDIYSKHLDSLFKTLKEKGAKNVMILAYWINYLKNNPYDANLEILKTETEKIINS